MAVNAIGLKVLMVKTVAQSVKIKINQKFPKQPFYVWIIGCKGRLCQPLKSWADKTGWALRFVILQKSQWSEINYGTVEKLVITLTGVIS